MQRTACVRERAHRRALALVAAATITALIGSLAGIAGADDIDVDGDNLAPFASNPLNFGTLCPGASDTKSAAIVLLHNSNSANWWADSAVVSISPGTPSDSQVTAAAVTPITLPANWTSLGTSPPARSDPTAAGLTLAVDAGASPGPKSATILYTASGAKFTTPPSTLTRAETLTVNWTVDTEANCAPTNTPPEVTTDAAAVSVDEGQQAMNTGTWSDADADDTVTLSASVGTVTQSGSNAAGTWSWSYDTTDGPAQSQTVTVTADDGDATSTVTFDLTVANVAPTITGLTSDRTTVLVGQTVTFTGTATDPSTDDTSAGFDWRFKKSGDVSFGSYGTANTFTTSFSTCGVHAVDAVARDKDGGESSPFTSGPVSVYTAKFQSPLQEGRKNLVQRSSVVPVKIVVSCGGANLTGLTPAIRLLAGDSAPNADPDDVANLVPPSVSAADTTGVMRLSDDEAQYIYNLRVPDATTGAVYTIAVYPFGAGGGSARVLIEIRK